MLVIFPCFMFHLSGENLILNGTLMQFFSCKFSINEIKKNGNISGHAVQAWGLLNEVYVG